MRSRVLLFAGLVLAAVVANAETKSVINFKPVTCMRGGELPLLQMQVDGKGELRAYFRRINTTDWCSVEGVNDGPLSRIVLPKFDNGDEIEYFIVLIDGNRVIARSPRIYRAKITPESEATWARHLNQLSLSCGEDVGGIPAAMGAGYAVGKPREPEPATPSRPH
jgi:hypothetical protein